MEQHQTLVIAKRLLEEMVKQNKNEISSSDVRVNCKSSLEEEQIFKAIDFLCFPGNATWRVSGYRTHKITGYKIVYFTY